MMEWKDIQQQWQRDVELPQTSDMLAAVQKRDAQLRSTLRRRDRLETAVGLLVAPVFGFAAWRAGLREEWLQLFFALFLAAWAAYVPLHLWRTRRRLPTPHADRPLLEFLREEHAAMLAQARQLERIWVWYLAPCAFGVIGLSFSARGPSTSAWIYAVIVLGFCALLARLNQRAARTGFRQHARQIAQQISRLTEESGK